MGFEYLGINVLFGDTRRSDAIDRAVGRCIELGCTARRNERSDHVRYFGSSTDYAYAELAIDEAISRLQAECGSILLRFGDLDFTIGAYGDSARLPQTFGISLSIDSVHLSHSKSDVRSTTDRIRSLTIALHETRDPTLVWGDVPSPVSNRDPTVYLSVDALAGGTVDSLWWLTGLDSNAVESLGREVVFSTPAYSTTECDNGGAMLILTDRPTQFSDVAEARQAAEKHLRPRKP
jgi:hypothetical protein